MQPLIDVLILPSSVIRQQGENQIRLEALAGGVAGKLGATDIGVGVVQRAGLCFEYLLQRLQVLLLVNLQ